MKSFLRQTFFGGLFVVLPVTLSVMVLAQVVLSIRSAMEPFAAVLPFETLIPGLWAVLALALASFLAGLLLKVPPVQEAFNRARTSLALRFPLLRFLQNVEEVASGRTGDRAIRPALVEIEEALVPAFVVEELADGRFSVFVPAAPNPSQGAVYLLTPERVHLLDASLGQVARCVAHWGVGLGELASRVRVAPQKAE